MMAGVTPNAQDLPLRDIRERQEVGGELCLDTELRGAVEYEGVCRAVIVIDVIEDIEAWHRRDDARIDVAEALGVWARTELGGIGSVGQAY